MRQNSQSHFTPVDSNSCGSSFLNTVDNFCPWTSLDPYDAAPYQSVLISRLKQKYIVANMRIQGLDSSLIKLKKRIFSDRIYLLYLFFRIILIVNTHGVLEWTWEHIFSVNLFASIHFYDWLCYLFPLQVVDEPLETFYVVLIMS